MLRVACSVALAFSALSGLSPAQGFSPGAQKDVDAVTFALAFRAGKSDQFRNKPISGVGTSFHGAVNERLADGSTRISLIITLGAADPDGKVTPLTSWDDFVAADGARTTLVVALSGPDLPAPPAAGPTVYEFTGVYDGQVRTVARAPQTSGQTSGPVPRGFSPDIAGKDAGPCPGEQPRGTVPDASLYCAPLLTGATATVRR